MQRIKVGEVSEREKEEIIRLFERKNALKELFITLDSPYLAEAEKKSLQERIVADLVESNLKYSDWWQKMQRKYQWGSGENEQWAINFETREIFLEAPNGHCSGTGCSVDTSLKQGLWSDTVGT